MKAKKIGIADGLDIYKLSANDIRQALLKVLEDSKYRENAKKASWLFRDQKEKPLERTIWWAEYLIRNPNCEHLKSPAPQLGFIVSHSLDVISVVIICIFPIWLLCFVCFFGALKSVPVENLKRNIKKSNKIHKNHAKSVWKLFKMENWIKTILNDISIDYWVYLPMIWHKINYCLRVIVNWWQYIYHTEQSQHH